METDVPSPPDNLELSLKDEVRRLATIQCASKLKSVDLLMGQSDEVRIVTSLTCNVVELYSLNCLNKENQPRLLRSIRSQGHRSEVRAVAFSSDSLAVVTGSAESVKLWNRPSQVRINYHHQPLLQFYEFPMQNYHSFYLKGAFRISFHFCLF